MSDLFPYDLPPVRHLMDRLPPGQRSGPPWIVPCPGCGGAEPPRWPYVPDPQTNYAQMHASLASDRQRLRLSCTGNGRGERKCSALHLAVVLDLELDEFEPGLGCRKPVLRKPVPEVKPAPAVKPAPRKAKARKKSNPRTPYDRLRVLVQSVLAAKTAEVGERALLAAHREAIDLPGMDPAQVQDVLCAAAAAVGIPGDRAHALLRGECDDHR